MNTATAMTEKNVHYFDHIHNILMRYAHNGQVTELLTMLSLPQIHSSALFWRTCTYRRGITAAILTAAIQSRRANGVAYPHLLLLDDSSCRLTDARSHRPLRDDSTDADTVTNSMNNSATNHDIDSRASKSCSNATSTTANDEQNELDAHDGSSHRNSAHRITREGASFSPPPSALGTNQNLLSMVDLYMLLQCCSRRRDSVNSVSCTAEDSDEDGHAKHADEHNDDVCAVSSSKDALSGTGGHDDADAIHPSMTDIVLKNVLHYIEQPPQLGRQSTSQAAQDERKVYEDAPSPSPPSCVEQQQQQQQVSAIYDRAVQRQSIDLEVVIAILREGCREVRYVNPLTAASSGSDSMTTHTGGQAERASERRRSSTPSPRPRAESNEHPQQHHEAEESQHRPSLTSPHSCSRDGAVKSNDGEYKENDLVVSSTSSSSSLSPAAEITVSVHDTTTGNSTPNASSAAVSHKRAREDASGNVVGTNTDVARVSTLHNSSSLTAASPADDGACANSNCPNGEDRNNIGDNAEESVRDVVHSVGGADHKDAATTDAVTVSAVCPESSLNAIDMLQSLTPLSATTPPSHDFDSMLAHRVSAALKQHVAVAEEGSGGGSGSQALLDALCPASSSSSSTATSRTAVWHHTTPPQMRNADEPAVSFATAVTAAVGRTSCAGVSPAVPLDTRAALIHAFNAFNDEYDIREQAEGAKQGRMSGAAPKQADNNTASMSHGSNDNNDHTCVSNHSDAMMGRQGGSMPAGSGAVSPAMGRQVIRRRVHFTAAEDAAILQGIARFGLCTGRFQCIFQAYRDVWMPGRTPIKLYDHWRDALRHRAVRMFDPTPSNDDVHVTLSNRPAEECHDESADASCGL